MTSEPILEGHDHVRDRARLAVLYSYQILDTPAEPGFDDVVQLAAQICEAPVALVSLVDRDRQWFKARVGFSACETPLSQSVCSHALGQEGLFIIPDLRLDPRTADNLLVTRDPHVRFYAGVRLDTAEGQPLGTLCVLDHHPRPDGLTDAQMAGLRALGRQTIGQLELRRAVQSRDHLLSQQAQIKQALVAEAEQHHALVDTQRRVQAAAGKLDAILDAVVTGALRTFPHADGAVVEMVEGNALVCRASAGVSIPFPVGSPLPNDSNLSRLCVEEARPMICLDSQTDDRVDARLLARAEVGSMIVVPLFRHNEVAGTLKVQARKPFAFVDRDLAILALLASAMITGLSSVAEADARRAIRKVETFSRQVLESAIDYAIITTDLSGAITSWNEGACRILGWDEDQIIGRPISTFFTPEDRAAAVHDREMRQALTDGRGKDERWHCRRDGTLFWANGEMMPLRAEDGTVEGFLKILRDRTKERLAAEALSRSEAEGQRAKEALHAQTQAEGERLRSLLDDAPSFMAVLRGPDHRFELTNKAYRNLIGNRDVLGKNVREALPEIVGQGFYELLDSVHRSGQPFNGNEVEIVLHHAGTDMMEKRFINFVYQPIFGADGQVEGIFVNGSDVTESTEAKARIARLVMLGDRIRDAKAFPEIVSAAAEILGNTLEVSRCGYGKFDASGQHVKVVDDWRRGQSQTIAGFYTIEDFGKPFAEELRKGKIVVISDVATNPLTAANVETWRAIEVQSLVNLPIMDQGKLSAVMFMHDDRIRSWSEPDLRFALDVAERTTISIDRVEAEERQLLLAGELQHRMKNTLAMVQAIANQTMRTSATKEEAGKAFADRLFALSKAQDILTQTSWGGASIMTVIKAAVAPHDTAAETRFDISGPDLDLGAKSALSFSLALHELATNAAKYGALSSETGRVAIRWAVTGDGINNPTMNFHWSEEGGPPVVAPARSGFGSRVIKGGFPYDFKVALDYAPDGVRCHVKALVAAL